MERRKAQDIWLDEELEQAKLASQTALIFCHHPFFVSSADEDDSMWSVM